jgi:hypothetical protein
MKRFSAFPGFPYEPTQQETHSHPSLYIVAPDDIHNATAGFDKLSRMESVSSSAYYLLVAYLNIYFHFT